MHSNSFTVASRAAPMRAAFPRGPAPAGLGLHMPMPEPTPSGPPVPPLPQDIDPIEDPPEDGVTPTPPVQDPPVAPRSDVPERLARATLPARPRPNRVRPAPAPDARTSPARMQYRCPPRPHRTPA